MNRVGTNMDSWGRPGWNGWLRMPSTCIRKAVAQKVEDPRGNSAGEASVWFQSKDLVIGDVVGHREVVCPHDNLAPVLPLDGWSFGASWSMSLTFSPAD